MSTAMQFLIMGTLFGIGLATIYWSNREIKLENQMKVDQKIYSTKKLDITMQNVVERINKKILEVKRELTEEEKDEIIGQCCREKFNKEISAQNS